MSARTINFEASDVESSAIRNMADEAGTSEQSVIRQALRMYQLHLSRLKAGETVAWSGDVDRARIFAGSGHAGKAP